MASLGYDIGSSVETSPSRKKKKRKKHHGLLGKVSSEVSQFVGGGLNELEDLGRGIGPGLIAAGSALGHDVGHAATLGHWGGSFQTDEIAKAIARSYTNPAVSIYPHLLSANYNLLSHPGKALHELRVAGTMFGDRPVGPLLDVATVLSGGAAAAGKAGASIGRGGRLASEATLAGRPGMIQSALLKSAGYVPATREAYRAARVAGVLHPEMGRAFIPGVKRVGGRAADYFGKPETATLARQSTSLWTRKAQALRSPIWDAIAGVPSAVGARTTRDMLAAGSSVRAGRVAARTGRMVRGREVSRFLPAFEAAAAKLSAPERVAWWLHHAGINPDQYVHLMTDETGLTDLSEADRIARKAEAATITDQVRTVFDAPTLQVTRALATSRKLANEGNEALLLPHMSQRELLARRSLVRDVAEGVRWEKTHPTITEPTPRAITAQKKLEAHRKQQAQRRADAEALAIVEAADRAKAHARAMSLADQVEAALPPRTRVVKRPRTEAEYLAAHNVHDSLLSRVLKGNKTKVRNIVAGARPGAGMGRIAFGAGGHQDFRFGVRERGLGLDAVPKHVKAAQAAERKAAQAASEEAMLGDLVRAFGEGKSLAELYGLAEEAVSSGDNALLGASADQIAQIMREAGIDETLAAAYAKAYERIQAMPAKGEILDFPPELRLPGEAPPDYGEIQRVIRMYAPNAAKAIEQGRLTKKDYWAIEKVARKIRREAGRVGERGQIGARIDQRITSASIPNARERKLVEKAAERRLAAFESLPGYRAKEPVAFGVPLVDERAAMTDAELAAAQEGTAYLPLGAPTERARSAMGGRRMGATVAGEPGTPGVMKLATDYNLLHGRVDKNPKTLANASRQLAVHAQLMQIFGQVLRHRLSPHDPLVVHNAGAFVFLNLPKQAKLARKIEEQLGIAKNIEALTGDEGMGQLRQSLEEAFFATQKEGGGFHEGVIAVPRTMYEAAFGDFKAQGQISKLFSVPNKLYRFLVLATRPAWAVNDIIGTSLLLWARHASPTLAKSMVDYYIDTKGPQWAQKFLRRAVADPATRTRWDGVMQRWASELFGESMAGREIGDISKLREKGRGGKVSHAVWKAALYVPGKIQEASIVLAGDIPRAILMRKLITPHVKEAVRTNPEKWAGAAFDDVAESLLKENPALRDQLVQQTMEDLVDYSSLTPFEQNALRNVVPFYAWLRSMTTWTMRLGFDDPWKANAFLVSLGNVGIEQNRGRQIPTYMQGYTFLGEPSGGRQRAIPTAGLSPFGTISEVSQIARELIGGGRTQRGSLFAGQLSPVIQYPIQAFTGRDLFTQAPIGGPQGRLANIAYQWASQTSPYLGAANVGARNIAGVSLAPTLISGAAPSSVHAGTTARQYWLSQLGVPTRQVDLEVAGARAYEDRMRQLHPEWYSQARF